MKTLYATAFTMCLAMPGLAVGEDTESADVEYFFVDLQQAANQKLDENLHSDDFADNNLAKLPQGEQELGGVKFQIGKQLIQLSSQHVANPPSEVKGLEVDLPVAKLHFLHACGYYDEEGAKIGQYTIHYGDDTKATIPIEYAVDVLDWWRPDAPEELSRGKEAWRGTNPAAESNGREICLYRTTWVNPHPDKDVVTIDFTSAGRPLAAPFCIAITAELE